MDLTAIRAWINTPPDATFINLNTISAGFRVDILNVVTASGFSRQQLIDQCIANAYNHRINTSRVAGTINIWMSGLIGITELFRPNNTATNVTNYSVTIVEGSSSATNRNADLRVKGSALNSTTALGADNNNIRRVVAWQPALLTGLGARIQDGKIYFPSTLTLFRVPSGALARTIGLTAAVSGEVINEPGYYSIRRLNYY